MDGLLAYDLQEISKDPACLDDGNFWAVSTTFEGEWICARFERVVHAPLPTARQSWAKINGTWLSSLDKSSYENYVEEIRSRISVGDVYQVNACRQLKVALAEGASLLPLMHLIQEQNPAPFGCYLRTAELEIASASPELLARRNGSRITSGPIKGTHALGAEYFGEKDQAENIMIVDLIRNDVGRISQIGSVTVPRLLVSEDHPGLTHLVSDVQGEILVGTSWADIANAILPPGSVSGAPKSSAVRIISELEVLPRGPYCGALGWVHGDQSLLSVAIRIFWNQGDEFLRFGTGAGITWGSDSTGEWEETVLKASRLLSISGGAI